jgi:hypothetical protein
MSKSIAIAVSIALLSTAAMSTVASAQAKTRDEVRQELIQAENNGSQLVTDTSYPDVAPIFESRVAQLKRNTDSGTGTEPMGTSAAGKAVIAAPRTDHSTCVGPVSFCTPYFGG